MKKNDNMTMKTIQGAKKGGGGGAVEASDTLRSKSFARVLDAIGEGEIEGLVNGLNSIYLDGTRLQAADGGFNFEGVQVDLRQGTQGQEHIAGISAVENEVNVSVEVKKETPVVRTITNLNVNAVRVKLMIPQLSKQDKSNGNIDGSSVTVGIDLQTGSGAFVRQVTDEIVGKTMSRYERSYRIQLAGAGPWAIRMVRLTDKAEDSSIQNTTFFSSMTEIIDAKLSYPNTAMVGIRLDASQFSSIPTRAYHMKLLRVRVPSNYDPKTRVYTGAWDGTFKIAWSNNPAWCFYDLITSARYGLGQHIPEEMVDKWSLYRIGRYCDEQVPDGRGGTEPRFTLNVYLQTREDSYKLLNDMASAFRGMLHWAGGSVVVTQDAPSDPTYLFTNSNVVEGAFSYSGTSASARHTVALVSWNDLSDMGRQKVEYVEDAEGIARYGVVETEVAAFGCTSQAQAHRVGRWILASELTETETATFVTGMEGAMAHPGQIIKVRDNYRHSKRMGGRVRSATGGTITLDAPVVMESGREYRLFVIGADGALHETEVHNGPGEHTQLDMQSSMDAPAVPGATWVLSASADGKDKTYRIISVSEKGDGTYEVTALEHSPDKYAIADEGTKLDGGQNADSGAGSTAFNPNGVSAPTAINVAVSDYISGSTQKFRVALGWRHEDGLSHWEVETRYEAENPVLVTPVGTAMYEINDARQGYHSFRVRAVNMVGQKSPWAVGPSAYAGRKQLDSSVVFSSATATGGFLRIKVRWTLAPAVADSIKLVEVYGYGFARSPGLKPDLLASITAPEPSWLHEERHPGETWTYFLRAVDQFGNKSDFYPPLGVEGVANVDVTAVINGMSDSFYQSDFFKDLTGKIEEIPLEEINQLIGGGGSMERINSEIERIRQDQNKSGELLLRSVVVDEVVRAEAIEGTARALEAVNILEDELALEVNRRLVLETRVGESEAAFVQEQTARASGDSALASQLTALNASVEGDLAATNALIVQEQTARANGDSASAAQVTALRAAMETADAATVAQIRTEEDARATADSAAASRMNTIAASVVTADANARALISAEQSARANADSSLATQVTGVQTSFNNLSSRVATEETTRANADAANATSITQVSARLNNVGGVTLEQRFNAQASNLSGLNAQYTVKINNNGHVSGFGLASVPINGSPVSTFAVVADRFVIAAPNGATTTPFQVVTSGYYLNGEYVAPGVYMNDAFMRRGFITEAYIGTASVGTLKIAGNAVTLPSGASLPSRSYASVPLSLPPLETNGAPGWLYVKFNYGPGQNSGLFWIAVRVNGVEIARWSASNYINGDAGSSSFAVDVKEGFYIPSTGATTTIQLVNLNPGQEGIGPSVAAGAHIFFLALKR